MPQTSQKQMPHQQPQAQIAPTAGLPVRTHILAGKADNITAPSYSYD